MRIVVHGQPAPQGSKRHVGRGILIESSKRVKPWREAVHYAALESLDGKPRIEGPVSVCVRFYFDRPRAHYRTGKNAHLLRDDAPALPDNKGTYDLDKLQRACFDALSSAGIWRDDSQVADVVACKRWTVQLPGELAVPGAVIDVMPLDRGGVA